MKITKTDYQMYSSLYVLKALDHLLESKSANLERVESAIQQEKKLHENIVQSLKNGLPPPLLECSNIIPFHQEPHFALIDSLMSKSWPEADFQSRAYLNAQGINHDHLDFDKTEHTFLPEDFGAAIAIGILGAALPSIKYGEKNADSIAGFFGNHQDGVFKDIIESLMGDSNSEWIDTISGQYHRFADSSHDISRIVLDSFSSTPIHGVLAKKLIAHLIVDAFGPTGVPLIGSTYLKKIIHSILPKDYHLTSAWHSRIAGYRHSDLFATGFTSLGLYIYFNTCSIPKSSFRRKKIAIIAHLTTSFGAYALTAAFPRYMGAKRSLVNSVSLSMFLKNCIELHIQSNAMRAETDNLQSETNKALDELMISIGIKV